MTVIKYIDTVDSQLLVSYIENVDLKERHFVIDTIIFDFDGIILDSEPLHFQAWKTTVNRLGIALDYNEYIENYTGQRDRDMIPRLLSDKKVKLSASEMEALVQTKINEYKKITQTMTEPPMVPDFDRFLSDLHQRFTNIGICSGSYRPDIDNALVALQKGRFKPYFKTIVTAEDIQEGKPSPEGYLLAAKRLERQPEHCVVIEDSPQGIKAARAAGMLVIGMLTSFSRERLSEADILVENYQELIAFSKSRSYLFKKI